MGKIFDFFMNFIMDLILIGILTLCFCIVYTSKEYDRKLEQQKIINQFQPKGYEIIEPNNKPQEEKQ